jgi:Zn-dependent protease with chaperone function
MTHALLIAAFLLTHLLGGWRSGEDTSSGMQWVGWLAPFAAMGLIVWVQAYRRLRRLETTGLVLHANRAMRAGHRVRALGVVVHTATLITLDQLTMVRQIVGDMVLVDELITTMPVLALFIWSWWSTQPVEALLREATLLRRLDDPVGAGLERMPSRSGAVWLRVRQEMLFVVVPVALLLGMGETISMLAFGLTLADPAFRIEHPNAPLPPGWATSLPEWMQTQKAATLLAGPIMLLGAGVLLSLFPLAIRWLWGTVELGAGPLRERIETRLRACGVRVQRLAVWPTGAGGLGGANAAVVGFVPPLRDMLFTDVLLEGLTLPEIEAVTAHEAAHLRQHHAIWLALAVLGSGSLGGLLATQVAQGVGVPVAWIGSLAGGIAIAAAVGVVLLVSRRFEWQADAHAARSMATDSRYGPMAMADALVRVAMLNGVAHNKASWRHGSIALRCRRLNRLQESGVEKLGIDRSVRVLKVAILLSLVAAVSSAAWVLPPVF